MTLHATREDTYRPTPEDAVLDYYRLPSPMTALEGFAPFVRTLPDDPAGIVGVVQKLLIYEHVAEDFYGVKLPPARREESHIRPVAEMLRQLAGRAGALTRNGYAPPDRLCGICRHFALAATALMRAKGIPARLRGGFGSLAARAATCRPTPQAPEGSSPASRAVRGHRPRHGCDACVRGRGSEAFSHAHSMTNNR